MPTLILNGARLPIRLVEIDVRKLKLDPSNPRLHSSYLTHDLPASPSQSQLAHALAQLPEFQSLLDALVRNEGSFQPPLVTQDLRVLEGNRRVAALRRLRAENARKSRWETLTVHQLTKRITDSQEKAVRAKFHLEGMLAWDGLSQLMEYVAVADRDGADHLAMILGRFTRQLEPLLVAGQCIRVFSQAYPAVRSQELLWVLVGLCGVKRVEPEVALSRSARCIFTANDEERPTQQPFSLSQVMHWLVAGRFTKPFETSDGRTIMLKARQVAPAFRRVRQAGEEALAYLLEPDGSLSKAITFLDAGHETLHWRRKQAINLTHKYLDLLNQQGPIRRDREQLTAQLQVEREAVRERRLRLLLELALAPGSEEKIAQCLEAAFGGAGRCSVGWVSGQLQRAGAAALSVMNRMEVRGALRAAAVDELFRHRQPLLTLVEPRTLMAVVPEPAQNRQGQTWQQTLAQYPHLKHVISDQATGLTKGVALDERPLTHQYDLFHFKRELRREWRRLEARCYDEMAAVERARKLVDARRMLSSAQVQALVEYREKAAALDYQLEAFDWTEVIVAYLEEACTPFDERRGCLRSSLSAQAMVDKVLELLRAVRAVHTRNLISLVEGARPGLFTFLQVLEEKLAGLTVRWRIIEGSRRALCDDLARC